MMTNDQSYREREADELEHMPERNGLTVAATSRSAVTTPPASDLVDETTLAKRLGVSRATLQSWRYAGRGPTYIKVGRFIRYRHSDVEAFLDSNARALS